MGVAATQILIDRVRGDDGPNKTIVLETALKIRDSIGVPAEAHIPQLKAPGFSAKVSAGVRRK
jgi:hypothetical protein